MVGASGSKSRSLALDGDWITSIAVAGGVAPLPSPLTATSTRRLAAVSTRSGAVVVVRVADALGLPSILHRLALPAGDFARGVALAADATRLVLGGNSGIVYALTLDVATTGVPSIRANEGTDPP